MVAKLGLFIGAAGLTATLTVAIPADAQYYPPPSNQGGILGAIVNQYRYGQYPYANYGYNQYGNERFGIDRCARAVEQRLGGRTSYYQGNRYNRYRNFGRVEGITRVQRKSYGLKVSGVASSGYGGYQGYGNQRYGTFGYGAGADLSFECKVYSNGRIRDIDIRRRIASWQGY
jgi:hypothetical protein